MVVRSGQNSETSKLAGLPDFVRHPDPTIYRSNNYVVLDFETTTTLNGSPLVDENSVVLAAWVRGKDRGGDNNNPMRHIFGGEFALGSLVEAISRADFLVAHNAKFELGWLRRCGLDLRSVLVWDTQTADYVLGGNSYGLHQLSLNACLARRGMPQKEDTVGLMIKSGVPMEHIPASWLLTYCERDVDLTEQLFLRQRDEIFDAGLENIAYQRNLVTPCLADIEFNGVQLDNDEVLKLEQEYEQSYLALTSRLQDACDGANPGSPKQLGEFIYGHLGFSVPKDHRGNELRTPTGGYSTAQAVMEKLVAKTKRQRKFLRLYNEWNRLDSDLSKYVRKFGDCVRQDNGRLRANFNQHNTRTHRFSSSGVAYKVQFQNFSRAFKPLFTARERGWLVGEADGAQLEFRVAAHLGRDRVALDDIVSGRDIHSYTANIVGVSRQAAKRHTFKPLYGGSSGTEREKAYYEAFKDRYRGIADTQQSWTQRVLRDKYLETEWGLKYYWPDVRMTRSGYIIYTPSIYNYPVQALATAEIIPVALVCAWHRMAKLQSFLVNTVHDSIIAELHPDEVEAWHEVAKQCLIEDSYNVISALYGVALTVPLGAGVKVASHWGRGEEVVYEADESLWRDAAEKEGMI